MSTQRVLATTYLQEQGCHVESDQAGALIKWSVKHSDGRWILVDQPYWELEALAQQMGWKEIPIAAGHTR